MTGNYFNVVKCFVLIAGIKQDTGRIIVILMQIAAIMLCGRVRICVCDYVHTFSTLFKSLNSYCFGCLPMYDISVRFGLNDVIKNASDINNCKLHTISKMLNFLFKHKVTVLIKKIENKFGIPMKESSTFIQFVIYLWMKHIVFVVVGRRCKFSHCITSYSECSLNKITKETQKNEQYSSLIILYYCRNGI